MHNMKNDIQGSRGPQTAGSTLHNTGQYDVCAAILGTGVNRPNSRMVVEMAGIQPGDKVLDVGCGTGSLTLTAKSYAGAQGWVYGIDASPEMIDAARKKAVESGIDANFEVGLIEKLSFPDASFDVVINRLVIHHLPDDLKRGAFAEIFRVLKPGGLFFAADFKAPSNPLLAHLLLPLIGHQMMKRSDVFGIPPMLTEAGFVDVLSGPTRSAFLAYASGKKPIS